MKTEEPVNPSQLINAFAYAFIVPEEIEQPTGAEESTAVPQSISVVERTLRKYIAGNLESLEPDLKLVSEEYSIEAGRMRIDILAKDGDANYVVIELKAEIADQSTFGQISAYMGWVKKNLAKDGFVRGIIVANDFDDRIKYAVQSGSNIKLKRYKLNFQFGDETP
jgi:RecB family endonuclease NucS